MPSSRLCSQPLALTCFPFPAASPPSHVGTLSSFGFSLLLLHLLYQLLLSEVQAAVTRSSLSALFSWGTSSSPLALNTIYLLFNCRSVSPAKSELHPLTSHLSIWLFHKISELTGVRLDLVFPLKAPPNLLLLATYLSPSPGVNPSISFSLAAPCLIS